MQIFFTFNRALAVHGTGLARHLLFLQIEKYFGEERTNEITPTS
jgi:hypothetical protein